ncbi:Fc.00g064200.m01.CDS01 [Cosmosporella sp. VM-42]
MTKSLRHILGKSSRIRKPSRPTPPRRDPPSPSPRKASRKARDEGLFTEKLEDHGLTKLLSEDLTLRDVVQAMRYIRSRMFTPVPPTGLHSTRTAEVLNYRLAIPPIITTGHLNAILNAPSRTEREVVELTGKAVLRRVRVERRGWTGEALIETRDLEGMLARSEVKEGTRRKFVEFLKGNPTSQAMGTGMLEIGEVDELVRAGFLTSSTHIDPGSTLHVRPEDRTTLTSIQHVSQFASGTVSAVGGRNAIHLAGGSGGGAPTLTHSPSHASSFRISIPGHGRYLKLAEAAVDWVRETLGTTKWGEGPESWLRERFEGGGLYGGRWKEFWGVEWDWVLGEAIGLGVVEVFETGSVGRGVRALGG